MSDYVSSDCGSSDDGGHDGEASDVVLAEFSLYKKQNVIVGDGAKFDILQWWSKEAQTFPILQLVAKNVLAVPASSAKSESNFSDGGKTITKLRNRLSPRIVDDLLFYRSMLKGKSDLHVHECVNTFQCIIGVVANFG